MKLFKNLYKYREFFKTSVKKEVRGKYKGAWLGVIWSYLNPILMLIVYNFVFSTVLRIDIPNYAMYLFTALIPWNFFATSLAEGSGCVINNGDILKKVYFPREIVPISSVTANLVNFAISCIILFIFLIFSGVGLSSYIIFLPIIMFLEYLIILGVVFILSALTVYARDIMHIVTVLLMAGIYAVPVMYTLDMVPSKYQILVKINPLTTIINSFRDILFYHQMPNWQSIVIVFIFALLLLFIGYNIFKKMEKRFVEEL